MLEQAVQKQTRIRCKHTKRLVATIERGGPGMYVWCRYTKTSELITWEEIDAARLPEAEAKAQEQHQDQSEAC